MNKLKKFMKSSKITQADMAIAIGAHQPDVSRWVNGKKNVPVRYCKKIEEFTRGELSVIDLRPKDWKLYWPNYQNYETSRKADR